METKDTGCNPRTLNRNQGCWMEMKKTEVKPKKKDWKPRILDGNQ